MSAENETHAAVIDEMHGFKCRNLATGELEECTCISKYLADRAEAAHKREVEKLNSVIQATVSCSDAEIDRLRREVAELRKQIGNAAKLREACTAGLDMIFDLQVRGRSPIANSVYAVRRKFSAALAEPPRNCDVGSVQEQRKRFDNFCKKGKLSRIDLGAYCADDCPCGKSFDCKLEWAQMPYNESEAGK